MDRGACWAIVHGVAKESDTTEQLNNNNSSNILMSDFLVFVAETPVYPSSSLASLEQSCRTI